MQRPPNRRYAPAALPEEFVSLSTTLTHRPPRVLFVWYALMILASVGLFFAIRAYGENLASAGPRVASSEKAVPAALVSHPLLHLLLALVAVIVLGRLFALVFSRWGQPPVIGEVLAGICLGPSLLGRVWPQASAFLLPPEVAPSLSIVAQIGVILYMFVVGLELNVRLLRQQGHVALAISHASIVVPFVLGAALALWLYPLLAPSGISFTAFSLFLAVSMSITAFPVLARILTDRAMHKTSLGAIALACAATDDVTAWCLLALVVGVVQSNVEQAIFVTAATVGYIGIMVLVARPLLKRALAPYRVSGLSNLAFGLVLAGMLLSALATEAIGIHAIFGAFLFGACLPREQAIIDQLVERIEGLVSTFLLPAFFAFIGMRTEIGLLDQWSHWAICLVIIAVATAGKFGGSLVAARLGGLSWRLSASLGVLMNTRGLMELIVLGIGLDLGVISPELFAMMVIMALVTTLATAPILSALSAQQAAAAA